MSLVVLIKLVLQKKRVVYIALNELIRNSMQHAKDEWQPKTPPWVFTSTASFNFRRELFFFAASFSFLPWAFLFCRELFFFAVSFSLLPWAFLFCHELLFFAVSFSLLPWHLWAIGSVSDQDSVKLDKRGQGFSSIVESRKTSIDPALKSTLNMSKLMHSPGDLVTSFPVLSNQSAQGRKLFYFRIPRAKCQPWSTHERSKQKMGLWCFLRKKVPKFHHKSIQKICKNTISRGKHLTAWLIYFVTLKRQNNYWKIVWKRSSLRLVIHINCSLHQVFPEGEDWISLQFQPTCGLQNLLDVV